jgi:hypothetical protein
MPDANVPSTPLVFGMTQEPLSYENVESIKGGELLLMVPDSSGRKGWIPLSRAKAEVSKAGVNIHAN